MVYHERPDDDNRPLETYICNPNQKSMVEKCVELLTNFPMLKVWEVQYPSAKNYTCFYISFKHKETPWILNFTIYPNFTNVEFRYSQYLPYEVLDNFRWITSNWAYIKFTEQNRKRICELLNIYIDNIRGDFDARKLKQGGKSFAEKLIVDILKVAFPDLQIKRNVRPDWLKNDKGNRLELDIFFPEIKLAIEIQGPQHFIPIWGKEQFSNLVKNDAYKKEVCKQKNIKLMWISIEAINKDLLRLPSEKKIKVISDLITNFINSKHSFLNLKNI